MVVVKSGSRFQRLLRDELRDAFFNPLPPKERKAMISLWDILLGVIVAVMFLVIVYLLWDIHTIVSMNSQTLVEVIHQGLRP